MDETRLAAIRAAEQKATPGPWSDGQPAVMSFGHYVASDGGAITGTCAPVNVHFIATARTAVPELLGLVDSLQRDNQELRAENERLRGLTRCICGPDRTGEAPDPRPDCPQHGVDAGTNRWPTEAPF